MLALELYILIIGKPILNIDLRPPCEELYPKEAQTYVTKFEAGPLTEVINDFPMHGIVTINELEAATGLRFIPDMPGFLAKPLKADRPTRLWPIRLRDIFKLILLRFT